MTETLQGIAEVVGWRVEAVSDVEAISRAGERSYIVVATQGHFDEPALEAALATPGGLRRSGRLAEAGLVGEGLAEGARACARWP